ncbi:hypothetical protein BC830DRAFT_1133810 [Chytriomyces sp. MP71]|nr:hypothetical protein BC830DRAFT_1133810 [Chytriomyces sp. MP71]
MASHFDFSDSSSLHPQMASPGGQFSEGREFMGPGGHVNLLIEEADTDVGMHTGATGGPRIPLPPFIIPSSHQSALPPLTADPFRSLRHSPVHPTYAQLQSQTLFPSPALSTKEQERDPDSQPSSPGASESSSSSHHRDKRKLFKCSWEGCGKVFTESYNLKSHFFLHANVRPFKCQFCEASFVRHRDLLRHESSVHETGSKDHKCYTCGFLFARKDSLRRHAKKCKK